MRVGRDHASRDGDGGGATRDGARRRRIAHASAVTLYLNRCDVIIIYRTGYRYTTIMYGPVAYSKSPILRNQRLEISTLGFFEFLGP